MRRPLPGAFSHVAHRHSSPCFTAIFEYSGLQASEMPDCLDDAWCSVGPSGKHKHCGPATAAPPAETKGKGPGPNASLSFADLPGPALNSIFCQSDCVTGHILAQTCHTCAKEYFHYRSLSTFSAKCCGELLPNFSLVALCSSMILMIFPTSLSSTTTG